MEQREPARTRTKQKQNTFFGGAAILAMGILVVKLIGMFYKIPLVNIIGEQGTADFNNAYNIYSVLLTISTAGLPVAVSKMVSEANALGRRNQVRRVFQLSLGLFLGLGIVSFIIMYFRADWLAGLMNDTKAAPSIQALAPAVVCVGCLAAFRGYSQGHRNMTPTSVSQIIEALCKLFIGLALAYTLVQAGQPAEVAAAGAITGVTVGTVVALIYMVINFLLARRGEEKSSDRPEASGTIIRKLLKIAIPITIGSSMVGIVTAVDAALVQGQLQRVLLEDPRTWELYAGYIDFSVVETALESWKATLPAGSDITMAALEAQVAQELAAGTTQSVAQTLHSTLESISRTLYGNYSGAVNIYNLPNALMAAITASVIPAVSGALARHDRKGASQVTGSALRFTALLALPMSVGLFVLGTPIMRLLFSGLNPDLAGPMLSVMGIANAFVCMMLVCNSVLQAYGFVNLPVVVLVLGGIVKIVTNYTVVAIPEVGIYGVPLGTVFCFALCLGLDLIIISRVIRDRPSYVRVFLKPAIASVVMGVGTWAVYGLVYKLLESNTIAVLVAIVIAVVIYGALIIAFKAISRQDLMLMPKGEKIAKLLRL